MMNSAFIRRLLIAVLSTQIVLSQATVPKIELKSLAHNPGILPLKLGNARIEKTHHTFLHDYPLTPLGKKLNELTSLFTEFLDKNTAQIKTDNQEEKSKYIEKKINYIRAQAETLHPDILKENPKTKRGLIDGLGSIFKFISGNLDASDGERYDKLIDDLKENQRNIVEQFNKQYSLNKKLTKKYEKIFTTMEKNIVDIKDAIVYTTAHQELINTFTMFELTLLDVEQTIANIQTAVSFASIRVLHLSIIDDEIIEEMRQELETFHEKNKFYYKDNILFTRTISVDYYITAERIVFCLHVPIIDPDIYDLYHLYSIPSDNLTTIIPPSAHVAMTDQTIYYLQDECRKIQGQYFCSNSHIKKNHQQDICIPRLLQVKTTPHCTQVPVEITETLVETVNEGKYIMIAPVETIVHEKCGNEEVHRLKGTYLLIVPYGCQFRTKDFTYVNQIGETKEEAVYLPPLPSNVSNVKPIQLNLKSVNLDELSKLTLQHSEIEPFSDWSISAALMHSNLTIYALIVIVILGFTIYKFRGRIEGIIRREPNHIYESPRSTFHDSSSSIIIRRP